MATTITSITTTTNTTTTTTTPVKEVCNKSTITTSSDTKTTTTTSTTTPIKEVCNKSTSNDTKATTITSTTTPIKEVYNKSTKTNIGAPSSTTKKVLVVEDKNKVNNLTWETEGPIQAQLCRDTYFGRYKPQTKATEIHRDPNRNYSKYNIQTLRNKLKEVRVLVKALHMYSIWLGENAIFYEMCRFHAYPTKAERHGMEDSYKSWDNQNRHDCEEKRGKHSEQRDSFPDFVPSTKKHFVSQFLKDVKINKEYSLDGEYSLQVDFPNVPNQSERLKVQYKGSSPIKLSVLHKSDADDCNPEVLLNEFAALSVGPEKKA